MNVLISSNSKLVAEGIQSMVKASFPIVNVTAAEGIDNFLQRLSNSLETKWNVILIDDYIAQFVGPRRLLKLVPNVKVCLMNVRKHHRENARSVRDGFHGLLLSESGQDQLETTLQALLDGKSFFPYDINVHKIYTIKPSQKINIDHKVTSRQQEIVSLISLGLSNKEIASHLDITESTVKRHVSNIFQKFGASNRVEAVRIATSRGLLTI